MVSFSMYVGDEDVKIVAKEDGEQMEIRVIKGDTGEVVVTVSEEKVEIWDDACSSLRVTYNIPDPDLHPGD